MAENTSPTPDPRTRGEHGAEHAAQAPFAVTRDYAAEVDEIRELGRTLGGEKKTPTPDPQAWREGYPYPELMDREEYELEKYRLQVELLKFQYWGQDTGAKHVIVFEGRDAAGKGGTIKRFMEHLNPRGARVVALEKPSATDTSCGAFFGAGHLIIAVVAILQGIERRLEPLAIHIGRTHRCVISA